MTLPALNLLADARWHHHGPGVHAWSNPLTRATWFFGVQWTPTLGRQSRQTLLDQLRREGVRWYAIHGRTNEMVGAMAGIVKRQQSCKRLGCAALGYAQAHQEGSHLLRLQCSNTHEWLVAVHQGCLISQSDLWVDDRLHADRLQADWLQRFPDMVVHQVKWLDEHADEPPVQLSFLLHTPPAAVCLRRHLASSRLTQSLLGLVVFLGVAWLVFWVWQGIFDLPKPPGHLTAPDPNTPASIPPQALAFHREPSIEQVVRHWYALPLEAAGWLLKDVHCQVAALETMHCKSTYMRANKRADNDQLATTLPTGWQLRPVTLDQTYAMKSIDMAVQRIHRAQLPSDATVVKAIQQTSHALPWIELGHQQVQSEHPPVSGPPTVSRSIALRMPLRELAKAVRWPASTRWSSMRLEIAPHAPIDADHGYLMLYLQGEIFGQIQ